MLETPNKLQELNPNATTVTGETIPVGGPTARGGYMGVYAQVVQGGRIPQGDSVRVLP